jgi:hypothetical protein
MPGSRLPRWWNADDAAAVAAAEAWQREAWLREADAAERSAWRCRRCRYWASEFGIFGACLIPETPATVRCGSTAAFQGCEQWEPRA